MLVQAQESLLRKAVIRFDCWPFREEYRHLEVDQDKWFTMGEKDQKHHLDVVFSEILGSVPKDVNTYVQITVIVLMGC